MAAAEVRGDAVHPVAPNETIARFREARHDSALVVLEGFHALKHAVRFGAELVEVVATDLPQLDRLAGSLAPDLRGSFGAAVVVSPEVLGRLSPHVPHTGVIAIARRPAVDVPVALADRREAPVVLLEQPRSLSNLGACVRVAAAGDAAAVLTTGAADPWHPEALRGAAGLQFALAVARVTELPACDRVVLAIDPEGEDLRPAELPARAVLAFGTERDGLSDELLERAAARVRIPMREGVSSLNLATSVAAVLFAWRLAAG